MFHLVEFTKEISPDGSMAQAIIPDDWVIGGDGTNCLWPPKGVNYKMFFNRYEPKQDWYQCDIRILFTSENYEVLKAKENVLCYTSDVSSHKTKKRKRHAPVIYSPDIATSSSEESGPPKEITWKKNSLKKAKMSSPITVSPAAMNVLENTDYSNHIGMVSPFAGSGLNQITGGPFLKTLSGKNSIDDQTEHVLDRIEKKIDKLFFLLETVREDLSAVQAQLQMKDMEEMQSNSNKIKYAAHGNYARLYSSKLPNSVEKRSGEGHWNLAFKCP